MFDILLILAFGWLFIKCMGLFFKVAWGAAKIVAAVLVVLALPALIAGALLAGGLILLLPILMVAAAWALIREA